MELPIKYNRYYIVTECYNIQKHFDELIKKGEKIIYYNEEPTDSFKYKIVIVTEKYNKL